MMRHHMCNLMSQNSRNAVLVLAQRQNACKDEHLASRYDESILLRAVDDMHLPRHIIHPFVFSALLTPLISFATVRSNPEEFGVATTISGSVKRPEPRALRASGG